MAGSCDCSNELPAFIKCCEFFEQLEPDGFSRGTLLLAVGRLLSWFVGWLIGWLVDFLVG